LNGTNDLVVVPNSVLAKSKIVNISGPDMSHGASLQVRLSLTRPPAAILQAMERVLLSSNLILKSPPPSANIIGLDRGALNVELSFRVADLGKVSSARNELYDLAYRHADAAGLQLAWAEGAAPLLGVPEPTPEAGIKRQTTPRRLMDAIPLFSALTSEEKDDLAANMNRLSFKKGDVVAHRGTALTSLMIVRSGVMAIEEIEENSNVELERLAPGDVFGERGVLMGALELGNVRALTAAVVYEIPKERFADIMRVRPAIAEDLASLLTARTVAEERLHDASRSPGGTASSSLSARIRHLFHLAG